MKELAPCPFCGCDQIHSHYKNDWVIPHALYCRNCRAYGPHKETSEEAIDAWNESAQTETCICAAIKTTCGKVIRGHRHHDCIAIIRASGIGELGSEKGIQGFVTSTNRFVTREEGYQLQEAAGIESIAEGGYRGARLFSEDLY